MQIKKRDYSDDEEKPVITTHEATSLRDFVRQERSAYASDLRGSQCHGSPLRVMAYVGSKTATIQWAPGDGGEYTLAKYRVA